MATLIKADFTLPLDAALFLDFDGTLVGFQDDPDAVHLGASEIECLLELNEKLDGALAIISGRDIRDLTKRVPISLWRLGNHGLFKAAPNMSATENLPQFPSIIRGVIEQKLSDIPEIWIEDKGPVIAIHYRKKAEAGPDINQLIAPVLADLKTHIIQNGNCVVEVKPVEANKGIALSQQMQSEPFLGRIPIMIGDDTTDEDGFIVAQRLGGLGIKIGAGQTEAQYRLATINDLYELLGSQR